VTPASAPLLFAFGLNGDGRLGDDQGLYPADTRAVNLGPIAADGLLRAGSQPLFGHGSGNSAAAEPEDSPAGLPVSGEFRRPHLRLTSLGATLVSPLDSWLDMSATTTLKLPTELKARIASLAEQTGRSPHSLMLEAIERHIEYEERVRDFVAEAVAADRDIERTGEVYAADDVHAWLERIAQGKKAPKPKPWRK